MLQNSAGPAGQLHRVPQRLELRREKLVYKPHGVQNVADNRGVELLLHQAKQFVIIVPEYHTYRSFFMVIKII